MDEFPVHRIGHDAHTDFTAGHIGRNCNVHSRSF
ncbi:hypothetical protein BALAC2494_02028 [Bifidobacterium animalis subsp. lactis CNCM I-2494]|uniref:Uncharacterized protein n=1 Tax=Bifidobacterium animalis subsp. lactis CNCM I-2494 TaxID=1042403 RepID=A0A806FM80_BIFAN|nr:hypothetical protein BALAC2494_02028 [Bifidobacterium animalis subsp. lactis CNCM I-2494]